MKRVVFSFLLLVPVLSGFAQRVVFDRDHFNIVNENGAMRLAADNIHNSYLNTVNGRLSDIKLNLASVVLVQNLILGSLKEVNQALKEGLAVVQIGRLTSEIVSESNQMISIASSDPYLLLFAEDVAAQVKNRGLRLVTEVSDFVLKEGEGVLMDYEKRDFLLRKVSLELQVIRSQVYSMGRAMYWAKFNGVLKTANPYRNFFNQDRQKADQIIRDARHLLQ
ncbi:hypothetical protein HDC92_004347 [Pedobacter sp. AK017]|uniref:hypothetical protein n=1 Tax=Pedobacter sp. AK017 TaxID=2723073 RepID=UPI00161BCDBF|nr:hypothetical protein [Pedobacter sp. AK017]MBB5440644.1 hypothetical protein [Pedobacter sp. AK017]